MLLAALLQSIRDARDYKHIRLLTANTGPKDCGLGGGKKVH
jgi:hypothetical protein